MNPLLAGIIGVALGVALVSYLAPSNEGSCCQRVANAGRDQIAGYAGADGTAGNTFVKGALDATGLTNALPGLLDMFGVPK